MHSCLRTGTKVAVGSMQGKSSNDPLDSVLHKLDYTFIDLPELIDDDEEPEPEPVYTQSVYAFDASRGQTAHEQQQQHQQQSPGTAVTGSYWQQLQQFSENKQPVQQVPAAVPGSLGSSLAQAVQQQYQQFGQQQQQQQQLPQLQQLQQQQPQLQLQQQPGWAWQPPYEPTTPPRGRPVAGGGAAAAGGSSSSDAGGMDEG